MQRGDFAAAWAVSDRILRERLDAGVVCHDWPRHLQFVWRGAPLAGRRVLVRCYHGLGDTIQFVRFARPLRRIASEVALWAQPALLRLVSTAAGVDRVLPLHDGIPEGQFDVDIEVMELAHALRTTLATLPRATPYLFPRRSCAYCPDPSRRAVGIVWRSGGWDDRRSIPIDLMRRLGRVAGVRLFSLQRGAPRIEAASLAAIDIGDDDIETVAARMQRLDLIVTVDTMVAHLAGALGLPTWTLLHHDADWRWMRGARTPWYRSMRLFRQSRPGDWAGVIDEVCGALARAAHHRPGRGRDAGERTLPSDVSVPGT